MEALQSTPTKTETKSQRVSVKQAVYLAGGAIEAALRSASEPAKRQYDKPLSERLAAARADLEQKARDYAKPFDSDAFDARGGKSRAIRQATHMLVMANVHYRDDFDLLFTLAGEAEALVVDHKSYVPYDKGVVVEKPAQEAPAPTIFEQRAQRDREVAAQMGLLTPDLEAILDAYSRGEKIQVPDSGAANEPETLAPTLEEPIAADAVVAAPAPRAPRGINHMWTLAALPERAFSQE